MQFQAFGHENVAGNHRTTLELTSEDFLTREGTCIIGVRSNQTLSQLAPEIKMLAASRETRIILRLRAKNLVEEIAGRGDPGLTYSDSVSMVARTSTYVCGRTLMVKADKAALDLGRTFVEVLQSPETVIECELIYITK
ncbi:MAG: DUF371 domain-containing protein [Candidatus Thorarchaeota archaeon]